MKTRTFLLVIILLGFSILLVTQVAVGITPSTYDLFVGEAPIGTCITAPLSLTNNSGVAGSVDTYDFLYSTDFDFVNPPPFPVVLGPGDSVDFLVEFCPVRGSFSMGDLVFNTSIGDITIYLNKLGLPVEEDSKADGVPDSSDNCIDTPNGENRGTWGKGEIGVILLFITSLILLGL